MKLFEALLIKQSDTLGTALERLDKTAMGILLLIDKNEQFLRTITDGDIRRLLIAGHNLQSTLDTLPSHESITIQEPYTRDEALNLMNSHVINHLPILNDKNKLCALLDRRTLEGKILLSTPHMGDEEQIFVEEAFSTNWIAPLGPNVDAFEQELANEVNVKACAALSSGTAAIHLALRLLGIEKNDRVFCSTLTFVASINPIFYQGAEPVLIDSEPESWNMSPSALERALQQAKAENKLPKAVIIVHLYGQSANMDPLIELCNAYNVPIIEDAAESLGASYKGQPSGTFGTFGIYSFNGNKIITTSGGGALVSNNIEMIEKARYLATQAREPAAHYQHEQIGYNYRMSNILAGVGRGQLKVLKKRVKARRHIFQTYQKLLKDCPAFSWMPEPEWSYSTHWLSAFTLNANLTDKTPEAIMNALNQKNIETRPLWKPMHAQPLCKNLSYYPHKENHSVSDALFKNGLCLPSGSNMQTFQIEFICDHLRKALQ